MVLANLTAMPDPFNYVGNTPASWVGDVRTGKSIIQSKVEALEDSSECIEANRQVLARSTKLIVWAVWLAWGSIVMGAIATTVAAGTISN